MTETEDEWWEDMMTVNFDEKFDEFYGGQPQSNVVRVYLDNMRQLGSEQTKIVELALYRQLGGTERGPGEMLHQSSAQRWPEKLAEFHELERQREDTTNFESQPPPRPDAEMPVADEAKSLFASESDKDGNFVDKEDAEDSTESAEENVQDQVKNVISEITGYPTEMIDEGIDLETDLSIDSIKRMEVAGALLDNFGLERNSIDNQALEELSSARSVSVVSEWIRRQLERIRTEETESAVRHLSATVDLTENEREDKPVTQVRRFVMQNRERDSLGE